MKIRTWMMAVLALPLTILVSACGGGGSDSGGPPPPFDPFAHTWTSVCQPSTTGNGFKYFVVFDSAQSTFTGNSASSYASANCSGSASRFGINVLTGNYVVGKKVTAMGGFDATEVNFTYSSFTQSNRTSVTPADFDLVYLDPATHVIYLGMKSASRPGTTSATRPNQIDFTNAWTTN